MSNEFSELIALSCPDLNANNASIVGGGGGGQVHIIDSSRRLSVKQMTATEFAAIRSAASDEIKAALVNVAATQSVSSPATPAVVNKLDLLTLNTGCKYPSDNTTPPEILSTNKSVADIPKPRSPPTDGFIISSSQLPSTYEHSVLLTREEHIPLSPAPLEGMTSLPNVFDKQVDEEFLSIVGGSGANVGNVLSSKTKADSPKPQLELNSEDNLSKGRGAVYDEYESSKRSTSKSSTDEYETPQNQHKISDSIELLRMHRCQRGLDAVAREVQPECSLSPVSPDGPSIISISSPRSHHVRSPAPDRLHSSSLSSIGSALSASASVSVSVNASKNTSRRGSAVSTAEEVATTLPAVVQPLSTFPLSKTTSTPNMERRRSSLSALFPGPSPLVAPEPVLHTNPLLPKNNLAIVETLPLDEDTSKRDIPAGKMVHRTKTPPPVGVKLGVNLKKVSPPRSQIGIKKNEAPMLGVVLRRVEKKPVQQKSILDDDKPLYHFSIVRSEKKDQKPVTVAPKPKPKPAIGLQKSATTVAVPPKPNPGGILTGPQGRTDTGLRPAHPVVQRPPQNQRPQLGVPITIQKIEGDKIIIIKKFVIPKNGKIPEQYLKVGWSFVLHLILVYVLAF
ncbi:uncharacterized protein LOC114804238 [Zeugodacus cucurbitae]|uniref:uncharacterized protein LOC114804238 n=1 Tax=Zeugodacus cucurbitae TaxID=28588 RepID=UPI0010A748CF|nr:uncharacterized protein LOC114804238 [Zeugodacus cucurbitae]